MEPTGDPLENGVDGGGETKRRQQVARRVRIWKMSANGQAYRSRQLRILRIPMDTQGLILFGARPPGRNRVTLGAGKLISTNAETTRLRTG
jgi:hypothetical protein